MSEREVKVVSLKKYRGMDVDSFGIVTISGEDVIRAAERCLPPDGKAPDSNLFNILLRQQVIAGAIVEVNGKPVKGTCQASVQWGSRTREFVGRAFDYMNGVTKDEIEDFDKALAGADRSETSQEKPTPTSSASGSSSPGT